MGEEVNSARFDPINATEVSLGAYARPEKTRASISRTAESPSRSSACPCWRTSYKPLPAEAWQSKVLPDNQKRRRGCPLVAHSGRHFWDRHIAGHADKLHRYGADA